MYVKIHQHYKEWALKVRICGTSKRNFSKLQKICLKHVERVYECMCKEEKPPTFISPRKNIKIQTSVTKLNDFERHF